MAPASPKYDVVETPKDGEIHKETPKPRSKLMEMLLGVPGIILGAVLGVLLGYLVQRTKPSAEVVSWIGVPGDLFIRAIKCCVTPLVFCSLVVGMADMIAVGKAGSIGWKTFWLYMITTFLASAEGLIAVLIFRPWFSNNAEPEPATATEFALQCTELGYYLSSGSNGTVSCVFDEAFNSTGSFSPASKFVVTDVNGVFALADSGYTELTLSESLQAQLQTMVPGNITSAFADGTLLSIIMFAIPFGAAIAILPRDMTLVANFFRESVFSGQPLPSTFAYIVAMDWFTDRFQTAVNVTGDTIITRIVAEHTGETLNAEERMSVANMTENLVAHNSELREVVHSTNNHV